MATLVIDIDNRSDIKKMIDTLYLFRGVKKVSLKEHPKFSELDKSIREAKLGKTIHCKNVSELMQNLNA
ncbi:MAG: hypothetical protein LBF81_05610 [Prevotellaceae bacterium]|jgi:hypothetical protein|nr:hypothetical protein [Prevotellaceae bacterium]